MMGSVIYVCILLGIFLFALQLPLDLDLGWHLRYGEYFFRTGHVLKENIISFVWPTYHWVQASWGFDLLEYQLFSHGGFIALSIAAAIIVIIIFYLITRPLRKRTLLEILILAGIFLSHTGPMYVSGLRSQTPSALFFTLILIISTTERIRKTKWFYVFPLLFFVWANMHGGFALGLILLGIIWTTHGILISIKKWKHTAWETIPVKTWIHWGMAIMASCLTPLLNPWGIRIYEETLKHSTNVNLSLIGEWMPITGGVVETIGVVVVVLLVMAVAWKRKKIMDIPYLIGFAVITCLGWNAIRFITNFGIMATFYLAETAAVSSWICVKKGRNVYTIIGSVVVILCVCFDACFTRQYFVFSADKLPTFSWKTYCQTLNTCSEGVTEMMLKNPPIGNGFHPYNYGGYLSWRVPQVQTFIDGRMAAWEDHGQTPPIVMGDRIFEDRQPIMFRNLDNQYHFRWMIIPTDSLLNEYLQKTTEWKRQYQDTGYTYYIKTTP